jgi:outer membrane receptor protein involved in Fe transport
MLKTISPFATRLLALVASLLLLAAAASAQSQATTGNIEGRVLDQNEAAIPNATVTARNEATGLEKTVNTDDEGNFRLILLPPGSYNVRATAANFAQLELEHVPVTVGGKTPLDLKLGVGSVKSEILIADELPVVETTRTSVATTVNQRAVENLPVNGRNYLDFATLTPGVVRDPTRDGDLSVGGQKGTLNNLQVDGADNNNTFFGQAFGRTGVRPPYQFSEESVQEFQVNQNGFSAEFGRAGGAVINVVTRSGTNQFHGGGFEYFRDESLNANTPNLKATQAQAFQLGLRADNNKRPPSQINQFGGRLGGPIVKNRAFFFFTYDGQRQKLPNPVEPPNFFTAAAATARPLLTPLINTYQVNRDQDVFLVKGDILINNSNNLSLRFNKQNFTGVNNEFTGPLAVEEHSGDSLARTHTFSGTLASTLSTSIVNELRFQFARDKEPGEANSDQPESQIQTGQGFLLIGRNNFSPRETTIKRAQFIDNVSLVRGRHNFKTGLDFNFDRIFNFFPGFFTGQYTFNSYADFAANRPARFQQRFGVPGTSGATTEPNSSDYSGFFQDDWRVTPKLTINAGVRYDYQALESPPLRNPDPVLLATGFDTSRQPQDRDNFSPRFGFSYAFDDKSVLRGGYGLFYGRTTAIVLGTAHSGNGIQTTGVNLTCTTTPANPCPVYPNIFTAQPAGGTLTSDLFLFPENYQQPYVQQARLGYEREAFANTSLSVTYLFFRGVHLTRTRDVNLRPPVATAATDPTTSLTYFVQRFPLTRPFGSYGRISLFESTGNSLYNGLATQLQRRFSRGLQFTVSYTYSFALDDKPDQTAVVPGGGDDAKVVQNSYDIRDDFRAADADLRHRLVISPVYELGRFKSDNAILSDYTFSGIAQLQSGFAYSATIGADVNRDGNARNDRVPSAARNVFRTPATYQFDARITRNIRLGEERRLRFIVEGFNIFNRANIATVNTNFFSSFTTNADGTLRFTLPAASGAFGLPRTFLSSRQLQLAIKFDF